MQYNFIELQKPEAKKHLETVLEEDIKHMFSFL